nr:Serine/arginine repetitive matrix protein [Ipomoea batatas]
MSVAKFGTLGTPDATRSDEGNNSLDTFIRQAIGKEPLLSFSRTGDSPVQLIQLLHALDQPDLPGWPLLTPLKVQMQKCVKCFREFCSPVNYRRHMRLHRRSLNFDKESRKYRGLLGAFWDKLTLEEVKKVASLNDVSLKEIPGTSLVNGLSMSICKAMVWTLPSVYVKAGSALLEIIQAKPCRLPLSSLELFSILDDASERTFLCAGTAEAVQKYVFDGEVAKVGLDLKNLIACTCFLFEQKLVKAWLVDKDAEALRCQKLLVEEEEAAQRRYDFIGHMKAELLEIKRQKKLRHKEQKARDQTNEEKVDIVVMADSLDDPLMAGVSSPPASSDSNSSSNLDVSVDDSCLEMVHLNKDQDVEAQKLFNENFEMAVQNVEPQLVLAKSQEQLANSQWQVQKPQRPGRNGFYGSQNHQDLKVEPVQKHGPPSVRGPVIDGKIWTRKVRPENNESLRQVSQKTEISQNQSDCEVMIGLISVPVKNCTQHQHGNNLEEAQDDSGNKQDSEPKKHNIPENQNKNVHSKYTTNRPANKHWRPVSRHDGGRQDQEDGVLVKVDDQTLSSEKFQQSHSMVNGNNKNHSCLPPEGNTHSEGLPLCSSVAKAFLAQRWKEAISADHVKLVLSPAPEAQCDTLEATSPSVNQEAFCGLDLQSNSLNRFEQQRFRFISDLLSGNEA